MITEISGIPVKLNQFKVNDTLLFALKKLSGDSENDIITHFYEIGVKLFLDCIRRKRLPQRCNRTVSIFYKDTNLHVKFDVWSGYLHDNVWHYKASIDLNMEIKFAQEIRHISGDAIEAMLAETGLNLSDEQVVEIEKPKNKLYKCLKR
jgi:hypothetical protein